MKNKNIDLRRQEMPIRVIVFLLNHFLLVVGPPTKICALGYD